MFQKKRKFINANNYGGFDLLENEYLIFNHKKTPQPWVNICANPDFGTMITEGGAMFTWYKNSYLFRITPRIDDPVLRSSGEEIYLKDDTTGEIWQPTKKSLARHGKGYSIFESRLGNLDTKITILTSINQPIKMIKIDLINNSKLEKIISATYYNQLVLGDGSDSAKQQVQVSFNQKKGLIEAKNSFQAEFNKTIVSVGVNDGAVSYLLDRAQFFGKRGDLKIPAALSKFQLPSKNLIANDPCGALSSLVRISPGKTKSLIFFMRINSNQLASKKISEEFFETELGKVKSYWSKACSNIEIKTPNLELDLLFNKQLLYQVISSRLWGRTGFYQPGGAYGYRDQLQDVIALCWSQPEIAKEHILKAAARQFFGGSVQHWWHPPGNAGVRSLSSDAHLWLVYVTNRYIEITGDVGILSEKRPYLLTGKSEHHGSDYFSPQASKEEYTLFEHCEESLNRTLYLFGKNKLPLILSGDWNDSLDLVGRDKRGESVWLGMFLAKILADFSKLAKNYGKSKKTEHYKAISQNLINQIDANCWDGEWYLRAYWDSGEKLGSKENDECQIDSLTQSWAAICGLNKKKAQTAINSANRKLIDTKSRTVKLFDPPFKNTKYDPGYILLYPPGIRENGGAYAHAAAWLAQGNAILGGGDVAMEIINYLNPLKRTITDNDILKYQAEPYVVSADIYTDKEYAGLAGWTWYTGSASVIYVTVLEEILGIKVRGEKLFIKPSVPRTWNSFSVRLRHKKATYQIEFRNKNLGQGQVKIYLDGKVTTKDYIRLKDKAVEHLIKVSF